MQRKSKSVIAFFLAKNVLLSDEYTRALLADFDSAKRLPDEFTEEDLPPLGTRGFVAPEVTRFNQF